MKEPYWLSREECLAAHDIMLRDYGGLAGVRDEVMLESALARPRNLFAYGSATMFDLAASCAAGVILNHPFLDGNKRTGFMLAVASLERNGIAFSATEADAALQTLALAAHALDETGYAAWLKANSARPRPKRKSAARRPRRS